MISAGHHPFFGWHEGWWWIFGILQAFLWVAVVIAVIALFRRRPSRGEAGAALRILEERYARGEISREEYLERRAVLENITSG